MQTNSVGRWLALVALSLAMLTVGLDTTVLNVALPTLADSFHADTTTLQWFSTSYTLAVAAAILPAGALGDRYGRKKFLFIALAIFGAASLWCAYAGSPAEMIAARSVLGLAAAVLLPLSMSVLPVLFPEPAERTRALTIWLTSTTIGMPLGPILGGWLLNNFWWGSVFLINVPMVLIGAAALAAWVPESRSSNRHLIDPISVVLSSVGLLALTYGFVQVGGRGWDDVWTWGTFALAAVVLTVFVDRQRWIEHPLVDLGLFRAAGFVWGSVYSVFCSFASFGLFFLMPLYLQGVHGVDAFGSGLRQLPMVAGMLFAIKLLSGLTKKAGPTKPLIAGFGLMAVGLLAAAMTTTDTAYLFVATWSFVIGVGIGITMPAATGQAVGTLGEERAGSGSALLTALRQAGGTIGVAILGTLLATQYRAELGPFNRPPISDGVDAGVGLARATHDLPMLDHVQTAFVSGMDFVLWVCAGICAAAIASIAVIGRKSTTPPAAQPVAANASDPAATS